MWGLPPSNKRETFGENNHQERFAKKKVRQLFEENIRWLSDKKIAAGLSKNGKSSQTVTTTKHQHEPIESSSLFAYFQVCMMGLFGGEKLDGHGRGRNGSWRIMMDGWRGGGSYNFFRNKKMLIKT